jgi:hypothetical protein
VYRRLGGGRKYSPNIFLPKSSPFASRVEEGQIKNGNIFRTIIGVVERQKKNENAFHRTQKKNEKRVSQDAEWRHLSS